MKFSPIQLIDFIRTGWRQTPLNHKLILAGSLLIASALMGAFLVVFNHQLEKRKPSIPSPSTEPVSQDAKPEPEPEPETPQPSPVIASNDAPRSDAVSATISALSVLVLFVIIPLAV